MRRSSYLVVFIVLSNELLNCSGRNLNAAHKKAIGPSGLTSSKKSSIATSSKKDHRNKLRDFGNLYEPVSLTLQLKFRRKNAGQLKPDKKRRKSLGRQLWAQGVTLQIPTAQDYMNSSRQRQDPQGFIHLFLPIGDFVPQEWQDFGSVSHQDSVLPNRLTAEQSSKKKYNKDEDQDRKDKTKKKKKKKKNKKKNPANNHHLATDTNRWKLTDNPDLSVSPAASPTSPSIKDVSANKKEKNIIPILDDDLIPPLLTTLSPKDTRKWINWLKCTVCLKNDESPLCSGSLCNSNNTIENELQRTLQLIDPCEDLCTTWQNCENSKAVATLFAHLPSCPCTYPAGLMYDDRVWDPLHHRHFRWREISLENERGDVYRAGATYCIRSVSIVQQMALSAQQCCYDAKRRLLTRGTAAGTPALVSPDASTQLSRITEKLPWLACKGDFSRYHLQRPPDNKLNCTVNPKEEEFQRQVLLAANY